VLRQLVKNMFAPLRDKDNFVIRYTDDEGDIISVSTDFELEEAYRQAAVHQPAVLRLFVTEDAKPIVPPLLQSSMNNSLTHIENGQPAGDSVVHPLLAPQIDREPEPQVASNQTMNVDNQNAAAPVTTSQAIADASILRQIEEQITLFLRSVSTFVDSLPIQQKVVELLADIHNHLKKASTTAQKKIFEPLGEITRTKAAEATEQLLKLKAEVSKLKLQLEAELEKTLNKLKGHSPSCDTADAATVNEQSTISTTAALDDLRTLEEMGFTDRARNLALLERYNGDIAQVVDALLAM